MKLTTVKSGNAIQTASDFRLYDDNGEPMKYVKSISFKVDPSESPTVIMVIERYVMAADEIDVDIASDHPGLEIKDVSR